VSRDHRKKEKEQLMLTLGQTSNRRHQRGEVLLLLAPHDSGRVLTR
jgi:hypothetical protein